MELPELHNYATLHKNDPYVVTLALSIANQKKQMKASKDGQAGMQPQPKVVDQELSQMVAPPPQQMPPQQMAAAPQQALPEDTGIGQLPAQNMQRLAEGGIVAFDDGGSVPGYAGGGVPPGALILGNMYKDPVTGEMKPIPEQSAVPFGDPAVMNARPYGQAKVDELLNKRKAAAQTIVNESPEDYAARKIAELEALGGKKLSPDARNQAMSQFVKDKIAGQVKRGEAGYTTESQLLPPVPDGRPLKPGQPPAAPGAAASSSEDAYMTGINNLLKGSQTGGGARTTLDAKRYDVTAPQLASATPKDMADRLAAAMGPNPTESPLAGQQTELNKANVASRQKYADDLAAHFEKQGEAFKGTLEKLTAKEKRVQTMEDNQLGMSMFEAGLAMMSGDSPYAMVNIGKGAQVGTKKYMEIQNQVEGARDKIDDAKMKIEEFRRNEANMNARELRLAKKDVNDAVSSGAQASLNLMREQYGLKHAEGLSFVNNSYQLEQFNATQTTLANTHNQSMRGALDMAAADRESRERTAANQNRTQLGLAALEAKRLPAEVRGVMVLGTGKTDAERYESGLRKAQDIASDKTGAVYASMYAKHIEDSRKNMTEPMSPQEFATSMRGILAAMSPKPPAPLNKPVGQVLK
jgi:hypothetical protein